MRGRYINLERSTDRRQAMEARLSELGLHDVARQLATDGQGLALPVGCAISRSELGCFLSHAAAIAAAGEGPHLVLEDDMRLSRDLPGVLKRLTADALGDAHLVFLDCQPRLSVDVLLALWRGVDQYTRQRAQEHAGAVAIYDAHGIYQFGAGAYIVTPRGRQELPALIKEAIAADPLLPFDGWLNTMIDARRIVASVLAPFLASPGVDPQAPTTMVGRAASEVSAPLQHGVRAALFLDQDAEMLDAFMRPHLLAPQSQDRRLQLLAELVAALAATSFMTYAGQ